MAKGRTDKPLKIDLSFENALKRILKAKPLPKKNAGTKNPRKPSKKRGGR